MARSAGSTIVTLCLNLTSRLYSSDNSDLMSSWSRRFQSVTLDVNWKTGIEWAIKVLPLANPITSTPVNNQQNHQENKKKLRSSPSAIALSTGLKGVAILVLCMTICIVFHGWYPQVPKDSKNLAKTSPMMYGVLGLNTKSLPPTGRWFKVQLNRFETFVFDESKWRWPCTGMQCIMGN